MDLSAADRHDEWNLRAIGALNVLHAGYWLQLIPGSGAVVTALFAADVGYLVADLGWLIFSPQCVQPSVRRTLLIHHGLVICCVPLAAGRIVLMRHLLRTWIVELHSWVHIAARRLQWAWAREQLRRANKPIYCALRLVGFPLTWVAYSRERAALLPAVRAAIVPTAVHLPLTAAHFAMYGLMCKWGYNLLVAPRGKPDSERA